jgi:hypothetical protein
MSDVPLTARQASADTGFFAAVIVGPGQAIEEASGNFLDEPIRKNQS